VAAAAPVEMGLRHGVYVHGGSAHRVQAYLHKPSADELAPGAPSIPMARCRSIRVGVAGCCHCPEIRGAHSIRGVGAICRVPPFEPTSDAALNFYGDLVLRWRSPPRSKTIWPTPVMGRPRPRCKSAAGDLAAPARHVLHVGAPASGDVHSLWHLARILETVAADAALQRICGWVPHAAAWSNRRSFSAGVDQFAVAQAVSPAQPDQRALIVDSCLRGALAWRGAAIVANVDTGQPIELAQDVVLDQLPLEQGFVTRIFGLYDDPKRPSSAGTL